MSDQEFFVGYQKQMPGGLSRFLRKIVWIVFGLFVILALAFAVLQGRFSEGHFHFGNVQTWEGLLLDEPRAHLRVPDDAGAFKSYMLVSFGKFGPPSFDTLHGSWVELKGTLIEREGQKMIELVEDSVKKLKFAVPQSMIKDHGPKTLKGEIVDTKCFLGVMKPGHGKIHRSCAIRCISGGIPPALLLRDPQGMSHLVYLKFSPDDKALFEQILDVVAEPVAISGNLMQVDDQWYLQLSSAKSIQRL